MLEVYHCMEHPTQEPLNILRYLSIISKSILSPEEEGGKKETWLLHCARGHIFYIHQA